MMPLIDLDSIVELREVENDRMINGSEKEDGQRDRETDGGMIEEWILSVPSGLFDKDQRSHSQNLNHIRMHAWTHKRRLCNIHHWCMRFDVSTHTRAWLLHSDHVHVKETRVKINQSSADKGSETRRNKRWNAPLMVASKYGCKGLSNRDLAPWDTTVQFSPEHCPSAAQSFKFHITWSVSSEELVSVAMHAEVWSDSSMCGLNVVGLCLLPWLANSDWAWDTIDAGDEKFRKAFSTKDVCSTEFYVETPLNHVLTKTAHFLDASASNLV